jgi:nucleotide-binding universal stress UspA family protein
MVQQKDPQPRARYVVVVGVDFSDASFNALQEAVRLTEGAPEAELHLVHVIGESISHASVGAFVAPDISYLDKIDEAGKTIERWLEPLRLKRARLAGHVRIGRPDREIAQIASDVGADLVVVGTQGKQGLERLLLGSVAESLVRHAPCAVLAHRSRSVAPWELIEAPCADCLAVRQVTGRATLWCERHSEHHLRAHTYREVPESFGMGSQTFR